MKIAFAVLFTVTLGLVLICLMVVMANTAALVVCALLLIILFCGLGIHEIQNFRARQELLENGCTFSNEEVIGVKTYKCKGIEKPFTLEAFLDGKVKLPEKAMSAEVQGVATAAPIAPRAVSAEKVD